MPYQRKSENQKTYERTSGHKVIAVSRIERRCKCIARNWPAPDVRGETGRRVSHLTSGRNKRRNARVSNPKYGASIFNGSKDHIGQMLSHHGRRSEIAIV